MIYKGKQLITFTRGIMKTHRIGNLWRVARTNQVADLDIGQIVLYHNIENLSAYLIEMSKIYFKK